MKPRQRMRGSFLVLTTWLLALLALLALGVSFRGHLQVRLASYDVDTVQTSLAARAGLQRVLELLAADTTEFDALNEPWAANAEALHDRDVMRDRTVFDVAYERPATSGEPQLIYGAQDEQSRLHVNTATAQMFARLPLMDDDVAQAIVAFRDAAEQPAEDAYYQTLSPPYTTKRAPFESLAELGLVRGMTPERFQIVLRYGTVYPKAGAAVNLNTAPREVLLALGLSAVLSDGILAYRAGADGLAGTADDGVFTAPAFDPDQWPWMSPEDASALNALLGSGALGVRSLAARIRVTGRTRDGTVQTTVEAVILRAGGQVLAWSVE